jgi:hypothetical protein
VAGNYMAIVGVQQARGSGPYGPHIIQNLYVHDNIVTQASGTSGIAQDDGGTLVFTSRNNRWVNNRYTVPSSNASPFVWSNRWLNWSGWRSFGQDLTGAYTQ